MDDSDGWLKHFKRNFGVIPDKTRLFWMGYFFIGVGIVLSGYWWYDGEPQWWVGITIMTGFYIFVWIMAYILRNNP